MAVQTNITITHGNETIGTIKGKFNQDSTLVNKTFHSIRNFFHALAGRDRSASVTTQVTSGDQTTASGTFTFTGHASANDTVLINGVTFTGETSGAGNNQWNIGASATATALALANAINASTTALVSGVVKATPAAGIVTISSLLSGQAGNAVTIAKGTDAGSVNTASGARLTGGAAPTTVSTTNTYHAGV